MSEKMPRSSFCDKAIVKLMTEENIPRTHENCEKYFNVSRPGKTAKDKARGAWKSKTERNSAHAARREALNKR